MISDFNKFSSSVVSVKIDDKTLYLHLVYDENLLPIEVELFINTGKYDDLSVIIPDSDELSHKEFFLNTKIDKRIVDTLVKESFIQETGKESVAGEDETKSYMLV